MIYGFGRFIKHTEIVKISQGENHWKNSGAVLYRQVMSAAMSKDTPV